MHSAYLYQIINLSVAILLVPLLLRYLDVSGFVLWSIFTTFGGITLQLENAIQMVSVREIAREYHSGNVVSLQAAIRKARAAYTILSAFVLVPFLVLGLLYLNYVASEKLGHHGSIEWLIFVSAYALNYYFGTKSAILLGMARVARYNNVNSLTRIINFIGTYLLLGMGLSVMGVSLSFAFSVMITCILMSYSARKTLENYSASKEIPIRPDAKFEHANSSNTLKYTFYMLASFILYKGGLLIATMIFPADVVGAYGLTLQAYTMLSTLAIVVPFQVWLHRLVSAVTTGSQENTLRELAVGMLIANTIFVAGAVLLALFGNMLLVLIDSEVMLPDEMNLFLIGLAFLVEMNIFLLVNFLIIANNYEFVRVYVIISLFGVASAIILTWLTRSSIATLIVVPLGLQALLCLPLIFRITCRELAITPMIFVGQLGRFIYLRS